MLSTLVRLLALLTHFLGTADFARTPTHSKAHEKEVFRCLQAFLSEGRFIGLSIMRFPKIRKNAYFFVADDIRMNPGIPQDPFHSHACTHTCTHLHTLARACTHTCRCRIPLAKHTHTHPHARAHAHTNMQPKLRKSGKQNSPCQDDKRQQTGHKYTHVHVYLCDCM